MFAFFSLRNPPAIFKSYCEIDVRYFPFDTQTCFMKFGSWSYSGLQMDLKHLHTTEDLIRMGMNLKDYYPSGEWDILAVPAERHARFYECCPNEFYAGMYNFFPFSKINLVVLFL